MKEHHQTFFAPPLFTPEKTGGTTVLIGMFVPDLDAVMTTATAASATLLSPTQDYDYDYGYRQAIIKDPFGHRWLIQQKI